MLDLIASLGAAVGEAQVTFYWIFDEPECPQTLIK